MSTLVLPPFVERYIERHQWGADPWNVVVGHPIPERQVVGLVLHHTVMPMLRGETIEAYMRRLQKVRPDLGAEVPYSVGVFPGSTAETCVIAVGRGKGRTGAHTAGLNSTRYGVFVPGDTDRQGLTPGQIAGIRWVGATWLRDPIGAVPTIGHQQAPPYASRGSNLNATGCPGRNGMAHMPELQPPFAAVASATIAKEWSDMASREEIAEIVAAEVAKGIRPQLWHEHSTGRVWYVPPGGGVRTWVDGPHTMDVLVAYRGCQVIYDVPSEVVRINADTGEVTDGLTMALDAIKAIPGAISHTQGG